MDGIKPYRRESLPELLTERYAENGFTEPPNFKGDIQVEKLRCLVNMLLIDFSSQLDGMTPERSQAMRKEFEIANSLEAFGMSKR